MMKFLWSSIKWFCGVIGTVVLAYITIESWVIGRAATVVDPVKVNVTNLSKRQDDLVKSMDSRINSLDEKINILIERK